MALDVRAFQPQSGARLTHYSNMAYNGRKRTEVCDGKISALFYWGL